MHYNSKSPEETAVFAEKFALNTPCPATITLTGDLGAGKTLFFRHFIRALAGAETEVTSPTFTICNIYETASGNIYHFDLYRLKHPSELLEIGLEEAIDNGICLIEWPEIAKEMLPAKRTDIKISFGETDAERIISINKI